jgi:hypothetical protein
MSESTKLTVRVPVTLANHLWEVADWAGRNQSEEVRYAIALHNLRATLACLESDEAKADLGENLHEIRATVAADLEALEVKAFGERPRQQHQPLHRFNLN